MFVKFFTSRAKTQGKFCRALCTDCPACTPLEDILGEKIAGLLKAIRPY
jgi:hypothetical protein